MLDQFIAIAAAGTVISYALYTVSADTVALHGTRGLIVTVPFVLYGMLRYLWKLHTRGGGGDPAQELLTDPHLLAATAGWLLLVIALLGGAIIHKAMISIDRIPNVESLGNALPFVGRIREIIEAIKLFEDFDPDELEGLARYMRCYRDSAGYRDHSRRR
jgi:hypothetical protein